MMGSPSLHQLLPLAALLLNLALVGLALQRDPHGAVNRVFAAFAGAMALWNAGALMLRLSPDAAAALFSERVIHVGVVALPALYYHFAVAFLGEAGRRRRALGWGYALGAAFTAINLSGTPLFMSGVKSTFWGWAPAAGPLYSVFFLYFNAWLLYGLAHLVRAHRGEASGYRRNRIRLVILGTFVSLTGGFVDFTRFIVARALPAADQAYPIGIPANMVFALLLGTSIVRSRLFDVTAAVKKGLVYGALFAGITVALAVGGWAVAGHLDWRDVGAPLVIGSVGLLATLLLGPLGRRMDALLERAMFRNRRGCYDSLLALSRRMSGILDLDRLTETLVQGVARGIPAARCALLVHDEATGAFVAARIETPTGVEAGPVRLSVGGPTVRWLGGSDRALVIDEIAVNPALAAHFTDRAAEVAGLRAAVLVPLRREQELVGLLLVGEKQSGEIFDAQELELLALLANQAATALDNARLYRTLQRAYEELTHTQAELAQSQKMEAVGRLAGGVAHDFNNLLTVITGRSELLLERLGAGDPMRRDLELVQKTADRAAALTQQLLAFSRKQVLQPRVIDLNAVVVGMDSMLRRLIGEDVELVTTVAPDLGRVTADPGQLEQVVMNLAVNARDAMPRGGRLGLRTANAEISPGGAGGVPPGSYAVLEVSDTGGGMDGETRARIFEPFFTTKETGKGTGLGLATVYGIVAQSGGHVTVDSALGQGATFRIFLPRAERQTPA